MSRKICKKACFTFKDWLAVTLVFGMLVGVVGAVFVIPLLAAYQSYGIPGIFGAIAAMSAFILFCWSLFWAINYIDKRDLL